LIAFDLVTTRDLRFTIRVMYRKPRFLEMLHAIREEMSREADYDVELFAEMARTGARPKHGPARNIRGFRVRVPRADEVAEKATLIRHRKRDAG
jgi:hypothetical protein